VRGSGKWLVRRADDRGEVGRAGFHSRPGVPSRACLTQLLGVGVLDELAVDDVGQAAPQAEHRFHRGLAVSELAPVVAAADGVLCSCTKPAMWSTWLILRFPARDSPWRICCPLEASIGAVPVQEAKRLRLGNLVTSAT
jgi:hypothetical protein